MYQKEMKRKLTIKLEKGQNGKMRLEFMEHQPQIIKRRKL